MEIDRRSFLRTAGGAAVGALVPVRLAEVAGAAEKPIRLDMATFTRQVNTPFKFQVGTRTVTMPLAAVVDNRTALAKSTRGAGESFSLIFAGPVPAFAQGTYTVNHTVLGRFAMFVVPVGRATTTQDYQAVFNRCMV